MLAAVKSRGFAIFIGVTVVVVVIGAIVELLWIGGVIIDDKIEGAVALVVLRGTEDDWIQVPWVALQVVRWADRWQLFVTLCVVAWVAWSYLYHGRWPGESR